MNQLITSTQNPKIKHLLALQQKSALRRQEQLFVVEGQRELMHCINNGMQIESVFVCNDIFGETPNEEVLQFLQSHASIDAYGRENRGTQCYDVSRNVYEAIAYRSTTEGIVAQVVCRQPSLSELKLSESPLVVVLESVEKPGNIGAILRSADASGVDAVIICDPRTDLFNPNLIRSSVGAFFSVQCTTCTTEECISWLKQNGISILTAQLQDSLPYYDTDMRRPTALIMGTEATGLTQPWRKAADAHIRIPMLGAVDSLNVSVSTAILMYEAVRQRFSAESIKTAAGKAINTALTLLVATLLLFSCSNANISHKKGDQALAIGEYYTASTHYKKAYTHTPSKDKPLRAKRAFLMAECYRHIGYTAKSIAAYQNAVRYGIPDSTAYLNLARQQLKAGNYKGAKQNFTTYIEKYDARNELAHSGLLSCELGPQWKNELSLYSIKKENAFNSRRADYSPLLVGDDADQLIFTSTRSDVTGEDINGVTGQLFGDLFSSTKNEQGKWSQPDVIDGDVNTEYDEGAPCLSPDGKTMYFTRCSSDPDYPRYAEIWQSARSDASWSKPAKCELTRDTLSSFAHPAVSPDGEWLYFVSDMPGGEGGLDIWRTRIMGDNKFGGVEALGRPINTSGDEMFPSFRPNGELYFSSDGHPGMGGLDLFCATPDSLRGWIVENLKAPMNSSADDFGMTFEGLHNRGYFCSSRNDGKGQEHIFSFVCPEVLQTVTGWVYEKDGYELPEAIVYMIGNDGTNEKLSVRMDGSFTQVIKPNVQYVFQGSCPGYLNVKNELCVQPVTESEDYVLQFPLPPINIPVLIDNIFYEFDKATLTPESTESLDRLVIMLKENSNITIELSAHCDYRGNDAYNMRLSQRRAESVVNYLTEHGIAADRMTAVGYGESRPKVITRKMTETYTFLKEGDTLTEEFILGHNTDEQEQMNALNRRTEFRVLRTTYGTTLKELSESEENK